MQYSLHRNALPLPKNILCATHQLCRTVKEGERGGHNDLHWTSLYQAIIWCPRLCRIVCSAWGWYDAANNDATATCLPYIQPTIHTTIHHTVIIIVDRMNIVITIECSDRYRVKRWKLALISLVCCPFKCFRGVWMAQLDLKLNWILWSNPGPSDQNHQIFAESKILAFSSNIWQSWQSWELWQI